MPYIENPKTADSGILCAIPQADTCPWRCADCFFQSGRSYLEPLSKNLPNMPSIEEAERKVVRINDGNDSSVNRPLVLRRTSRFPMRFYNTSRPDHLDEYGAPVVLTLNPGEMTDDDFWEVLKPPANLMFVRARVNSWNLGLIKDIIQYYALTRKVMVVLTFMAYHKPEDIKTGHIGYYTMRRRTLNDYWAITPWHWKTIMEEVSHFVHGDSHLFASCGHAEGINTSCRYCGVCLREYFATIVRMFDSKE